MIKFQCSSCQKKIGVKDDTAGRKVKCPQCGMILIVPDIEPISSPETSEPQSSFLPFWVWGLIGVFAVFLIGILVWAFAIRDTWERDHLEEIRRLADQAGSAVNAGDDKTGLDTYDRLFSLVGSHELKWEAKDIVAKTKSVYPEVQEIYEKKVVESLLPLAMDAQNVLTEASKASSGADVQDITSRLNKALADIKQILNIASARTPKGDNLKSLINRMKDAKRIIENKLNEINEKIRLAEKQKQEEAARQQVEQARLLEERKKRSEQVTQNPRPSYEEFCRGFVLHLKPFTGQDGQQRNWHTEFKYTLDKTDSMISPYIGTLEFYYIMPLKNDEIFLAPMKLFIALDNSKWVMRKLQTGMGDGTWVDTTTGFLGYKSIMEAFEETPNP